MGAAYLFHAQEQASIAHGQAVRDLATWQQQGRESDWKWKVHLQQRAAEPSAADIPFLRASPGPQTRSPNYDRQGRVTSETVLDWGPAR